MEVLAVVALWSVIGLVAAGAYRLNTQRVRTLDRFEEATLSTIGAEDAALERMTLRRLRRRWAWAPWVLGVLIAVTIWLVFGWPIQFVLAAGAVAALLLSQLEGMLHYRHIAKLERQLADAIDIMVGAVSAGAAVGAAVESATIETDRPLKPYLQEIASRIQLGDEPAGVFKALAESVPLETFLLFSASMSVHYEVGGRLAPTLATVGRTIRDRIEIARRIQSNIAQSQFSTFAIIGLVYFIAVIVWRNDPESMRAFVTSTAGSWVVAGSIVLQAVGIFWMDLISKPKF